MIAAQPSLFSAKAIPNWPFGDLAPFSYDFIMADPPWMFELYSDKGEKKSAQANYQCMDIDDIYNLPVGQLASENAFLFLWATAPMLPQALTTLTRWGFCYASMGFWHKKTVKNKTAFGTGYRLRSAAEPFLIGTIGNPQNSHSHRNLIEGLAREHSRKPDEAYTWALSYMPNARRADLFSRTTRPDWDAWGNEVGKFDEVEKK